MVTKLINIFYLWYIWNSYCIRNTYNPRDLSWTLFIKFRIIDIIYNRNGLYYVKCWIKALRKDYFILFYSCYNFKWDILYKLCILQCAAEIDLIWEICQHTVVQMAVSAFAIGAIYQTSSKFWCKNDFCFYVVWLLHIMPIR